MGHPSHHPYHKKGLMVEDLTWYQVPQQFSGADGCVRVARTRDGGILLASTLQPESAALPLTARELSAFVAWVRSDLFPLQELTD